MKTILLPTFVSLCLLAGNVGAAEFPNESVTDGIIVCGGFNLSLESAQKLRAAGVSGVRASFYWNELEDADGPVWDTYDTFVTNCAQAGLRVYANFEGLNPVYYQNPYDPVTQQDDYNTYEVDYFGSPDFRNPYDHHIQTTVNHYTTLANSLAQQYTNWKPQFTWELWNEPNLDFWPGHSADAFMDFAVGPVVPGQNENYTQGALQLIRDTANAVGGVAGSPTIVAPAVEMSHVDGCADAIPYLQTCIARGLLDKVDGVSIHPYLFWDAPENAIAYYDAVRSLSGDIRSSENPSGIPIVDAEWGYMSGAVGLQTQADYLQRTMLVNFSQNIPVSIWFTDTDNPEQNWTFGLFENITPWGGSPYGDPKPSFYAMQTLTSALQGTKYDRKLTDSNTNDWLTVFRSTTTNRETLAAWTTDIAGVSTVSDWGTYYLNGTPLYVGQSQTRAAGNGKWSDHSWDGGSTWVNGSQATFGNSGQTITVDGSPTISALQFNVDGVTLNGGTLNFTSGGGAIHTETGTATINSVIAGGGDPAVFQIRKSGTGTLTLGAANTITSEIIIGQGAVQLGNTDAVRNNTVTANVANGLKFSSGIGTFTLGSLAGSGNIALADTGGTAVALQVGNKNVDSSYSGILSGSGSLKKIGSGLLTLSGQNTYTGGTTISAGSLSLKFPTFGTSAPAAGSIKIESDGVLVANGAYTSVRTWINSGKINAGSEGVLATTANIASGSSSINMSNYAGLSIGSTGDYTLSRAVTPANNTYRFGGGGGNLNVSIVLGNNGSTPRSLVSRGNVTLTNSNTYSGTTTVDSGTLTLSSTGSINSTSGIMLNSGALLQNLSTVISITNGGTVGGTGTYAGDLDLGNGHLSPGDKPVAIGALRVTGNLSMSAESVLDYDWGSTAGSCDRLAFTESGGNLTLDGTINIISSGDIVRGSYAIVSGASSITDRGLDFGVVPAGHDWAYSIANDNGVYSVIVTAAPEPGTLALLATGLLGILAYAWRKRR